ncbi:hypothetical protein A2U01_0118314, partial [Trifolium medium]|nr:hypothetical protein [Trifolium medium]
GHVVKMEFMAVFFPPIPFFQSLGLAFDGSAAIGPRQKVLVSSPSTQPPKHEASGRRSAF